jgi:hypothetical protein
MKRYNLAPKVLCCTAKNKVLKKNVEGGFPETWWDEGDAEKLVKEGFLVPAEITEKVVVEAEVEEEETAEEVNETAEVVVEETLESKEEKIEDKVEPENVPYVNWTEAALKEVLTLRGVEFDETLKKAELYKLYKAGN